MKELAQKCVATARNVAEGGVPLGKLTHEGRDQPMLMLRSEMQGEMNASAFSAIQLDIIYHLCYWPSRIDSHSCC